MLIVIAAVMGGYAMAGGPFGILLQPSELVVIGGSAAGALVISAPGKVGRRVLIAFKRGFSGSAPVKADYVDLMKLLYQLFQLLRREGVLALEAHVSEVEKSDIFKRYPSVTKRHEAIEFLVEGLRQMVDGCTVEELTLMFDAELETLHEEEHQPISLLRATGDALPGLGIVAAVLGIILTMSHLDSPPEVIGHHVGAALVGTFLGILLCYGFLGPLATSVEMQAQASARYVESIKNGLLAAARGANPVVSVELARRAIFSDERPSSNELEKAFSEMKGG